MILETVPESFFNDLKHKLKTSADAAYVRLSTIKGIRPIKASAAMYMMVGLDLD